MACKRLELTAAQLYTRIILPYIIALLHDPIFLHTLSQSKELWSASNGRSVASARALPLRALGGLCVDWQSVHTCNIYEPERVLA